MDLPKEFENGIKVVGVEPGGIWSDAEHTSCDLMVTFGAFPDGPLPFTASQNDIEEHGRKLFEAAANGEFGEITEYAMTPAQANSVVSSLTTEATIRINAIAIEVGTLHDAVELDMATEDEIARLAVAEGELTAWKRYRVLLSRVQAQAGFPTSIAWPEKPE